MITITVADAEDTGIVLHMRKVADDAVDAAIGEILDRLSGPVRVELEQNGVIVEILHTLGHLRPVSLVKDAGAVRESQDNRALRQGRAVKSARKAVLLLNRPHYGVPSVPLVAECRGTYRAFTQVCPIG